MKTKSDRLACIDLLLLTNLGATEEGPVWGNKVRGGGGSGTSNLRGLERG